MSDHIHMLVSIPPKLSVSSFMRYLKGKSALMMFDKHANLCGRLQVNLPSKNISLEIGTFGQKDIM